LYDDSCCSCYLRPILVVAAAWCYNDEIRGDQNLNHCRSSCHKAKKMLSEDNYWKHEKSVRFNYFNIFFLINLLNLLFDSFPMKFSFQLPAHAFLSPLTVL
jgi:hypothetical protein